MGTNESGFLGDLGLFGEQAIDGMRESFRILESLPEETRVAAINSIRYELHKLSPFRDEPVDFVRWIKADSVIANDYNPNSVAPPEMKLLELSVEADGFTQPIVAWTNGSDFEVVDGFHRNRVGRESSSVKKRLHGYLPLAVINNDRADRSDRMAATIRHNRARGKHRVEAMSDIVVELKRRNWSDDKIGRELGMDPDEVLRLRQITGLAEMFSNEEFSQSWEIDSGDTTGGEVLSDDDNSGELSSKRIFHTWEKWECYRAGFYEEKPPGDMTQDQGEEAYREFLSDLSRFEAALVVVTETWTNSCEHYLTNERMNRIAWLGQASVAQAMGIPSCCRGGYHRLSEEQKSAADQLALDYLNKWLVARGEAPVERDQALSRTETELY